MADSTPERSSTGGSVASAALMTLLGTTCCALPITLVALGAGGAVASLASSAPWLVWLSQHKAWTFAATAVFLGVAWWQAGRAEACDVADAKRLRRQVWILRGSTALFALSTLAAYALLPLTRWWEGS